MGKIKDILIRDIQICWKAGHSVQEIAKELGCEEEIVLNIIGE